MDDAERLRAIFDDWARGDFTTAPALFADDIRFSATQPEGQVYETGTDGVARFMRRFLPEWDLYTVELHELEDLGAGRYLARATQHGVGNGSGMQITSPVWIAIRMRDGRLAQLEFHMSDRDGALTALGDP